MKKTLYFAIFIAFLFTLQSCEIMYYPNMQNVPLFKEKKEIKVTGSISNLQAAYSVTDHIGVLANAQFGMNEWSADGITFNQNNDLVDADYKFTSSRNFYEAGIGYFKPVSTNGIFEIYGGAGMGFVKFGRESKEESTGVVLNNYFFNANSTRFFIQPNIGYTNEVVDIAFSSRISGMKFSNIKTDFSEQTLIDNELKSVNKPLFLFIEPAITVRAGWKYVKFHTQFMYTHKLNSDKLNYLPFSFNAGIHVNIAPRYKKAKKD